MGVFFTATAVAGGNMASATPPLLRAGVPGEKKPLKEKLIAYYELIFQVQWNP